MQKIQVCIDENVKSNNDEDNHLNNVWNNENT